VKTDALRIDMLGFLLSQEELMTHNITTKDLSEVKLDMCHLTAAPPRPDSTCTFIAEQAAWLKQALKPLRSSCLRMFGIQHPPIDFGWNAIRDLRERSGILFSTIAYDLENRFGGGFAAPDAPLTQDGELLLEMMANAGMILDLSHAGKRSPMFVPVDLISVWSRPIQAVIPHMSIPGICRMTS
jgi:Membrane dipeptidase (Peptidase family M19)